MARRIAFEANILADILYKFYKFNIEKRAESANNLYEYASWLL